MYSNTGSVHGNEYKWMSIIFIAVFTKTQQQMYNIMMTQICTKMQSRSSRSKGTLLDRKKE